MSATFADGSTYTGQYFQINSNTTANFSGGMWTGPLGGAGLVDPGSEYQTHYSGRVLANLVNPSGDHLRCGFQLVHPSAGMAGGAHGLCEIPSGNVIEVSLQKS
jgi:hypothetical protein